MFSASLSAQETQLHTTRSVAIRAILLQDGKKLLFWNGSSCWVQTAVFPVIETSVICTVVRPALARLVLSQWNVVRNLIKMQCSAWYFAMIVGHWCLAVSFHAFRFGHSQVNTHLWRLHDNGTVVANGHLLLREGYFAPERLLREGGLEPLLSGSVYQRAQTIDTKVRKPQPYWLLTCHRPCKANVHTCSVSPLWLDHPCLMQSHPLCVCIILVHSYVSVSPACHFICLLHTYAQFLPHAWVLHDVSMPCVLTDGGWDAQCAISKSDWHSRAGSCISKHTARQGSRSSWLQHCAAGSGICKLVG